MKDFPEKQLVINYLLGICTDREAEKVEEWLEENPRHVYLLQEIAKNLEKDSPLSVADKEEIKKNIFAEIDDRSHQKNLSHSFKEKDHWSGNTSKTLFFIVPDFLFKAAAIILIIVLAGAGGYYYHQANKEQKEIVWQERTLPHGQTATFRFSDGSIIKLNGGSTLRYPQRFNDNLREVHLEGEAFFSIARNEAKPFIVHAGNITTRVLGTAFNVMAYDNEQKVEVAVAEGKVAVSQNKAGNNSVKRNKRIILEKNQWVTYQPESYLWEKGEGDIWEMIAWKDQVLVFNNKTFDEVARMLERWYGVEIIIKDEELKKVVLQGEHEDVSLEKVLDSIQFVLGIEYSMSGDAVTIYASHDKRINHTK